MGPHHMVGKGVALGFQRKFMKFDWVTSWKPAVRTLSPLSQNS